MLKSAVTNLTRFPIRRFDMTLGVAYKEDIGRVRALLLEAAERNPLGWKIPKPMFVFLGYGDSDSANAVLRVVQARELLLISKNSLYTDIKNLFDANGVEIPSPYGCWWPAATAFLSPLRLCNSNEKPENPVTGD